MRIADLLTAARVRRQTRRELLTGAILERFEVTGRHQDVVPRIAVVEVVSAKTGENLFLTELSQEVRELMVSLGAVAVKPNNRKVFRGVRRRGVIPPTG